VTDQEEGDYGKRSGKVAANGKVRLKAIRCRSRILGGGTTGRGLIIHMHVFVRNRLQSCPTCTQMPNFYVRMVSSEWRARAMNEIGFDWMVS